MTASSGTDAQPGEVVVRTHTLTKRYGAQIAVDALAMEVRRGSIYGLLGPNGAGKTTALRMLLGLIAPSGGSVELFGRDLAADGAAVLPRVGALVQAPAIYPYLSGRENLRMMAEVFGQVSARQIDRVLEMVGLAHRQHDRAERYSLGMRQRLAVGMALIRGPDLLVLDEPLTGLDPVGRRALLNLLVGEVAAVDKTVILSSHLLPDMEAMADRIGIMVDGKLVVEGELDTLRQFHARVRLGYAEPPSVETLSTLQRVPGVTWLKCEGRSVGLQVHGDVDATIAAIAAIAPPVTVETAYLTLDDIFLAYMRDAQEGDIVASA